MQSVHVSLLPHLLEDEHDGINGTTGGIEFVDGARGNLQLLLDKVVLCLQRRDEFVECCGSHFRHQVHGIGSGAKSEQLVRGDSSGSSHTRQAFSKLHDVVGCGRRSGRQLEHGRTDGHHGLLHAHLRDKAHHLRNLGKSRQRIRTKVLLQRHVHLIGRTDELFETFRAVLADTEFGTGVGNLVQFLDGGTGVQFREVFRQAVDVLHSQS